MQREPFTIERMYAGEIPFPPARPPKSWMQQRSAIDSRKTNGEVVEVVGFAVGFLLVLTALMVAAKRWRRRRLLRRSAAARSISQAVGQS